MEVGRIKIWYHSTFIPYVLVGKVHTFMGLLPKYIRKPQLLQYLFPIYHSYEPLMFIDEPFKFNFFKICVFYSSPLIEDVEYVKWLDRFEKKKIFFWKNRRHLWPNPVI